MDQDLSASRQSALEAKVLPEKRYCTSCQTDRAIEGGILQAYKNNGVTRRCWKCALCADRISKSRFSKKAALL